MNIPWQPGELAFKARRITVKTRHEDPVKIIYTNVPRPQFKNLRSFRFSRGYSYPHVFHGMVVTKAESTLETLLRVDGPHG